MGFRLDKRVLKMRSNRGFLISAAIIATFIALEACAAKYDNKENFCTVSVSVLSEKGEPTAGLNIRVQTVKKQSFFKSIYMATIGSLGEIVTVLETKTDSNGQATVRFKLGDNVSVYGEVPFAAMAIFGANSECKQKISVVFPNK